LAQTRGNSSTVAARGRILYDFSAMPAKAMPAVPAGVELDNREGKVTLSDLRSTTWEDGAARSSSSNRRTISTRL
jgi:hypothetical protein